MHDLAATRVAEAQLPSCTMHGSHAHQPVNFSQGRSVCTAAASSAIRLTLCLKIPRQSHSHATVLQAMHQPSANSTHRCLHKLQILKCHARKPQAPLPETSLVTAPAHRPFFSLQHDCRATHIAVRLPSVHHYTSTCSLYDTAVPTSVRTLIHNRSHIHVGAVPHRACWSKCCQRGGAQCTTAAPVLSGWP
jgi:hypothetical protein